MLAVLSPAKSLDYKTALPIQSHTGAAFLDEARELMTTLKTMAPEDISSLMGISENLGFLNFERNQAWSLPIDTDTGRQALLAFKGDVYVGLDAYDLNDADFAFAQDHVRILSGLYGVLRPLDLIQPYRLEMGTKLGTRRGRDLYQFWGARISEALNAQLQEMGSENLINLASREYFKAVDLNALDARVVTPVFKDWSKGSYKIISFFAKKARGRMSAFMIKNRLTQPEELLAFDWDGYRHDPGLSSKSEWVYTRREAC